VQLPEPATPRTEEIQLCVVRDGAVVRVPAQRNPATGDTTVAGEPFTAALPSGESAAAAAWFLADEPVVFAGRRFVKFGLPRVLDAGQVTRAGEFRGVGVFVAPGERIDVVYLPTGAGCEFQPYELEAKVGAVRG
jgi:hypothetical protein